MRSIKWFIAALAAFAIPASGQSPRSSSRPSRTARCCPPWRRRQRLQCAAQTAHDLTKADVDAWLDGFMPYALQGRRHRRRRRRRRQGRPAADRARLRLCRPRSRQARRPEPHPVPPRLGLEALHLDRGHAAGRRPARSTSTPTSTPTSISRFRRRTASRSRCGT